MFKNIFKDKRVLVTGHTGFKGSWLSLWLCKLGAQVTGLSLPPNTDPALFELIDLKKNVNHIEGDIRDFEVVNKAFEISDPEIVFHLAAQALVRDSYEDPKKTLDTNVGGSINILEAIRSSPSTEAVIIVTSDKCYENREWIWGYRENDPMGGHDPYSASKGAVELICSAYYRSFFSESGLSPKIGFSTVRAGNVIGGGDWSKNRIIPDCIRALSNNEPIVVRNSKSSRSWLHVLEPLSGYLFLASMLLEDRHTFSGPWNFGPFDNEAVTVGELVERFVSSWGCGRIEQISRPEVLHEALKLKLSIEKAVSNLNWFPVLNNSTAIDWTVRWYEEWHRGNTDLKTFSLNQIEDYKAVALSKKALWVK